MTLRFLIITVVFVLTTSGPGTTQKKDSAILILQSRPDSTSEENWPGKDEFIKTNAISQKNITDYRNQLKIELAEKEYWKKMAIAYLRDKKAAKEELANIKAQPAKHDTIMGHPIVVRTVQEGWVPIPGINKKQLEKAEKQTQAAFIKASRVIDDTVGYRYDTAKRN